MKKILIILFIATINYSCNHLKLAYNAFLDKKCEKAKKHLNKIPIEKIIEFPITYNLINAKRWECPNNNNDSSCFYLFKAYAMVDNISEKEKSFFDKLKINKQLIFNEIEKKNCITATERFLNYFEKNKVDDCVLSIPSNDSLTFFLNLGRKHADSLIAPACFALCKGIYQELLNKRKEACTHYSYYFDIDSRSNYDLLIIEKKRRLLSKEFLNNRKNVCKYYCQIAIDLLKNNECDTCANAYISLSENNNETTKFPLTTLYAQGLKSQNCLKDESKTCYYFGLILSMIANSPKDSLYLNVYKKEIKKIIETKKIYCYDTLKVQSEAPLKDVTNSLDILKKKIAETCKSNYRDKIIAPILTTDFIDSTSIKIGLIFNADVWTFYDGIGLGIYKPDVVEVLLKKAMSSLIDFLGTFDKVNLEAYVLGLADGTPINNVQYDGVFGQHIIKKYSLSNENMINDKTWYKSYKNESNSNVMNGNNINDVELALLRGLCADNIINTSLKGKGYDVNSKLFVYDYPDKKENEKPEYRRLEIIFIMRNVLNDIKKYYENSIEVANTWQKLIDIESKKIN